jgi:hypothetical protein
MKARCYIPTSKDYPNYGGRGIRVCDRWLHDFEVFYADMGPAPSPRHSLDRYPDTNGDYCPENCRWATNIEQQRNKTSNLVIEHEGRSMTLAEWAELLGIHYHTLYNRIRNRGWPIARAFIAPPKKSRRPHVAPR